MKELKLFVACSVLIGMMAASQSLMAQGTQSGRQHHLQQREKTINKRQENVERRNPHGYGRMDNRLERREQHVGRKQHRTDKRVKRRKGLE